MTWSGQAQQVTQRQETLAMLVAQQRDLAIASLTPPPDSENLGHVTATAAVPEIDFTTVPTHATALDRDLIAIRQSAQGDYASAVPDLEARVEQDPRDVERTLLLGRCYTGLGRYRDAELCYTRSEALWPQSIWPVYFRGLCRLELKDYARAERDFTTVLRSRPDLISAYVNRGLAREGQGQAIGAITDISYAIDQQAVSNPRMFLIRAKLWQQAGDLPQAEKDRAQGLALDPVDEEGWIARALARAETDAEGACRDLEQARIRYPRSSRVLQNLAHVLSDRLHRAAEVIPVLDQLLALRPENATALAGRGVLHARLGHRDRAEADARAALDRDSSPTTHYQVASIYARLAVGPDPQADDQTQSLNHLAAAVRGGWQWSEIALRDPDLEGLRDVPAFDELVRAVRTLRRPATMPTASTQDRSE